MIKKWKEFELFIADLLDGKRQAGSGLSPIASKKGDVKTDDFLVECKTTDDSTYLLTGKTLQKIVEQALQANKVPLMAIKTRRATFFASLGIDEIEPSLKNISGQTHSPCFSVSPLTVPENCVVNTEVRFTKQKKNNKKAIVYSVCIWRYNGEDTLPRKDS